MNKLGDWPPNHHKTVRTFPQIFWDPSFNETLASDKNFTRWFRYESNVMVSPPPLSTKSSNQFDYTS